jgi:hypothetical protein
MILHSGPPIAYADMCPLHRRGMVSGALFEGWAKTEAEAVSLLESGEIRIDSALDHNTVGAGAGIITRSVAMMVVEDQSTGIRAATFPAEGPFQGGLCGWGLYSPDIAENLRVMREELFPPLQALIRQRGGLPLKPILAESLQMGDENHTRQTAADLIFVKQILPALIGLDLPKATLHRVVDYIVQTPRLFYCFAQGACRAALLGAADTPYATMLTACGGNACEFGIQVAGLGKRWFTAPAMMISGRYTSGQFSVTDQLPWLGDSCNIECAGLGGMAAAASPIVCSLRGKALRDAIAQTQEMSAICIGQNSHYPIPNLDFACPPVGIDIRKVLETGITPELHGGMINRAGGLIGAGSARIPLLCFVKARQAFAETYNN